MTVEWGWESTYNGIQHKERERVKKMVRGEVKRQQIQVWTKQLWKRRARWAKWGWGGRRSGSIPETPIERTRRSKPMKLLVRTSLLIVGVGITLVLWERGGGLVGGYKRLVRVRYDRVAKGGRPSFSLPLLPPLLSSHSHLSPPLTTSHHLSPPLTTSHHLSPPLTTSHTSLTKTPHSCTQFYIT